MAKEPNYIYGRKSNSILIAEIVPTLRAQGNASGTGIIIDASADSPIVSGIYSNIPSISVDIMNVDSFADKSKNFIYVSGDNTRSHPWNSIGAVGLDGVFAPYSTQYDDDRTGPFLPHWTSPSISGTPTSTTLNPFNPFNNLQNISPSGHTVLNDPWSSGGHNISFALNYNPNDTGYNSIYPSGSGSPASYDFETDHFVRHTVETSGIRGVGLRSPIVLTGWGYDVNGDPVPSGTGIINGISGIHPEATWNPATWKSGPVDLRWDEERGVWTGGEGGEEFISFVIDNIPSGAGGTSAGCNYILATVTDIGHKTRTVSIGDSGIKIFDEDLCHFNLPISVLIGMKGKAMGYKNIYSDSVVDDCITEDMVSSPLRWVVTGLCCGEEIVDV